MGTLDQERSSTRPGTGSVCPCSSYFCEGLLAAAAHGTGLHPPFTSHLCLFKPGKDIFTDQAPEDRPCYHLNKCITEIKRFWSKGVKQVSTLQAPHSNGAGTAQEGRNINILRTHFFTSWAEHFCSSSGCVARRGALCPLQGYE